MPTTRFVAAILTSADMALALGPTKNTNDKERLLGAEEAFRKNLLHLVRAAHQRGIGVMPVLQYGPGVSANKERWPESKEYVAALVATDPDLKTSQGFVLNEFIYTPGQVQTATINVATAGVHTVNARGGVPSQSALPGLGPLVSDGHEVCL